MATGARIVPRFSELTPKKLGSAKTVGINNHHIHGSLVQVIVCGAENRSSSFTFCFASPVVHGTGSQECFEKSQCRPIVGRPKMICGRQM